MLEKSNVVPTKSIGLVSNLPVFDLRPFDANAQTRDVFSMTTTENTTNAVENTPKGQLPDHLKIVGILIAHPSQIVIEDSLTKITYFIDEARPQDGIKIKRVGKDQMIINYQGQDIPVPISKN